jgi:H+/gluconate symporter-like permease
VVLSASAMPCQYRHTRRQYVNMTVIETFKTWTDMETIISVVAIVLIMSLAQLV